METKVAPLQTYRLGLMGTRGRVREELKFIPQTHIILSQMLLHEETVWPQMCCYFSKPCAQWYKENDPYRQ